MMEQNEHEGPPEDPMEAISWYWHTFAQNPKKGMGKREF
jgi:hypothetical protein